MSRILKTWLSIFAVCCIGLAGYVVGYFQGYIGGRGDPALVEAMTNVEVLTALHEARYDKAIQQLETSLDARLVERGAYLSSNFQLAPLFSIQQNAEEYREKIRSYREAHPSTTVDREIQEMAERALSK